MKKILTLLAVGSIAFGVVSAAAASLGTIGTNSTIGASTAVVAACDSDGFNVSYATTYNTSISDYTITSVTVGSASGTSVNKVASDCNGDNISISLADADGGDALDTTTGTAATDTATYILTGSPVRASAVVKVAVLIQAN